MVRFSWCCLCREVADKNAAEFTADKTRNLIVRLQFNVIRAGLRRINLAYSRISLADVAQRLGNALTQHVQLRALRCLAVCALCMTVQILRVRQHVLHCAASSVTTCPPILQLVLTATCYALLCRPEQCEGHRVYCCQGNQGRRH